MTEPKPLAALSSGLLARKGEARPAMRPQMFGGPADGADDLGWNDMGDPAALPAVLREREALKGEVERPTTLVSLATAARLRSETVRKGKAAFTLRLDHERHLKLRLATVTRGRSAQHLVTAALDAFLSTLPEVEALVAHLPPHHTR